MDFDLQNAIIPVIIVDILKGSHTGGSHTINADSVSLAVVNVSLCGLLTRDEDKLDQPWYTLKDGSGSIKIAHTSDHESVEKCGSAKVIGNVRSDANGDFYIQAVTINASNDINVLSCHLLERKMAFKLHTKGLPPSLKEQYGMTDVALPLSGPTLKKGKSGDAKESVLDFIRSNGTARFSSLQKQFPGINLNSILTDLEQEDGHIFDASDDNPDDKLYQAV